MIKCHTNGKSIVCRWRYRWRSTSDWWHDILEIPHWGGQHRLHWVTCKCWPPCERGPGLREEENGEMNQLSARVIHFTKQMIEAPPPWISMFDDVEVLEWNGVDLAFLSFCLLFSSIDKCHHWWLKVIFHPCSELLFAAHKSNSEFAKSSCHGCYVQMVDVLGGDRMRPLRGYC